MPPVKGKRVSSSRSKANPVAAVEAAPSFLPTKSGTPMRSPVRSPTKRQGMITQAQKQALIDNLQLEVTERARKLRAQYALQAQGLRTRLEIRIHRIPTALRKTKIADLLQKHAEKPSGLRVQDARPAVVTKGVTNVASTTLSIGQSPVKTMKPLPPLQATSHGIKRTSTDMEDNDKENNTAQTPAKRARGPYAASTSKSAINRPASPRVDAGKVLSPKSANSRTPPPKSPYKASFSPTKSNIARPTSPLKAAPYIAQSTAASLAKVAEKPKPRAVSSRAASRQGTTAAAAPTRTKRAAPTTATAHVNVTVEESAGRLSGASNATSTSTATTVVTKSKRAAMASAAGSAGGATVAATKAKKSGLVGKLAGMGVKAKKAAVPQPEPQPTGRVLRKRG